METKPIETISDKFKRMKALAAVPMRDDSEIKRVEIILLKFKEEKRVIDDCVSRIIHNTTWPFKLNIFDNRGNTANTSRAWNKLVRESTCDYVLIMDTDAFVPEGIDPCWLTRMMESIDETGIVIPVSDNVGGAGQKADGAKAYPSARVNKSIWSGFCFLFKKSTYEKLGEFDERFYAYGQDSEWAHRAIGIGGAIMREDVFVKHIGSYSFDKADTEGAFDKETDKLYARELFRFTTKQ